MHRKPIAEDVYTLLFQQETACGSLSVVHFGVSLPRDTVTVARVLGLVEMYILSTVPCLVRCSGCTEVVPICIASSPESVWSRNIWTSTISEMLSLPVHTKTHLYVRICVFYIYLNAAYILCWATDLFRGRICVSDTVIYSPTRNKVYLHLQWYLT